MIVEQFQGNYLKLPNKGRKTSKSLDRAEWEALVNKLRRRPREIEQMNAKIEVSLDTEEDILRHRISPIVSIQYIGLAIQNQAISQE